MVLNTDRIRTLAVEARSALEKLDSFSSMSKSDFLANQAVMERVRYNFIVVLQACIDISSHIAARQGNRAPASYGDCFKVLEEVKVIDPTLSGAMQRLVGLRNVLVHLYWRVDDEKVFESLQRDRSLEREFLGVATRLAVE